ncbi:MAG: YitT family protein [Bacillaceae bacterium]|uniref:YitT family protein n=1 Tax=Aeribacillus composti TaxID=1868734 RepID=A0ABY9W708_9BACI|nr:MULTISPECIES: YitT family protein [Aeribacillus]AXI39995.1 YitT family protein [Bacillaceae bacterium ZC4]REJ20462.1 MAG: YitT family protein [Bacillaceae bacterium]MDR9792937.1 YitT family protein [Aeribacillus pallidus]MDR9795550.1 YitT family protein [Aeribacillus pallidus]MED0648971.1 YitT family protein [Aeribacillus composti]
MLPFKLKNLFFILLGSAIFSFGLVHFNMQNNLAEGGFTGITLLLFFLFQINPSISNLVLNVPIFFIGWKLLGKTTFLYTLIGTISVSFFLWIFQLHPFHIPLHEDLTLAALFAGVFIGVGLGIIFRYGGTTGGVDIIARLVYKFFGISMGKTMFLFDACVITLSSIFYLSYREAMYTLVAVFIGTRVIDFIQEGAYRAKAATIISEKHEEIAEKIMKDMDRGVTILKGQGSFTKQNRNILYCVVAKNEFVKLKQVITAVDPHAFVVVSDVHDVLGEGFTLDENKNPIEH